MSLTFSSGSSAADFRGMLLTRERVASAMSCFIPGVGLKLLPLPPLPISWEAVGAAPTNNPGGSSAEAFADPVPPLPRPAPELE